MVRSILVTFSDYLIPTAVDMPELISGYTVTLSPTNPLGVKGGGEGGIIGAPAAIVNAICDAYSQEALSFKTDYKARGTIFQDQKITKIRSYGAKPQSDSLPRIGVHLFHILER